MREVKELVSGHTQVNERARFQTQAVWLQDPCCQSGCYIAPSFSLAGYVGYSVLVDHHSVRFINLAFPSFLSTDIYRWLLYIFLFFPIPVACQNSQSFISSSIVSIIILKSLSENFIIFASVFVPITDCFS